MSQEDNILMIKELFPVKKEIINNLFYFLKQDAFPTSHMEYFFYQNKDIKGFYPLEFMSTFNYLNDRINKRVIDLTEVRAPEDITFFSNSSAFIFSNFTPMHSQYLNLADFLREEGKKKTTEEHQIYNRLANGLIIYDNTIDKMKKATFKTDRFLNKVFESKNEKKLQAWGIIADYLIDRNLKNKNLELLPVIQELFNDAGDANITFTTNEGKKKFEEGFKNIQTIIMHNSLNDKLDTKEDHKPSGFKI